jgi:ribosomal protein L19E
MIQNTWQGIKVLIQSGWTKIQASNLMARGRLHEDIEAEFSELKTETKAKRKGPKPGAKNSKRPLKQKTVNSEKSL